MKNNFPTIFGIIAVASFTAGASAQAPAISSPGTPIVGMCNVLDFGAKPDGTTDCTAAVQSAIDSVAVKGGVVFVPA